jgi:acetyl-CoA carboxylase biotin carboxyl carrier protein
VPLSPEDVRALVAAFDGSEWDEMTLTIDGTHLVLSRTGRPPGTAAASGTATPSAAPPAPAVAPPAAGPAARGAVPAVTTPTSTGTPPAAPPSAPPATPPAAPGAVPPAPDGSAEPRPPAATPAAVTGHRVTAPSVGLFWRSPKPGAPPFVEVGDEVGPDDTVCIVEVMKLMNHVRAGVAGTVLAVHPENGQMVEHGDPLFTVEPAR